MIIDVHVHAWDAFSVLSSEKFLEWMANLDEGVHAWTGTPMMVGGPLIFSAEGLISMMDEAGIDKVCLLGLEDSEGVIITNDALMNIVNSHPDRFIGFGGLDPLKGPEKTVPEIEQMVKEFGFKGLKLHPDTGYYFCNDEKLCYPVYEKAQELGITILIHMGFDFNPALLKYARPILLDDVATAFPRLKIICAHAGYPWVEETAVLLLKHKNFYTDISFIETFCPESRYQQIIKYLVDTFPQAIDHIVFGSDFPAGPNPQEINLFKTGLDRVRNLDFLSEEEKKKILGENAARMLGIEG